MRHIKYAVALVLFLIAFVATAERFVYHLAHFEETFWQISFEYSLYGGDGADEVVKTNLQKSIQAYSFDIYCIDTEYLSDYQEIRTIYGTDGALADLYKRGIRPKTYHSIFTGNVKIVFKSFNEIEDIFDRNDFFVVGPIANAAAFKGATDASRFYSVDDIKDVSGSEDGIYATLFLIWGIVFLLILLLTLYQNLLAKKEMIVRLTLGESPYRTFLKNALVDAFAYIGLFFSTYAVLVLFLPVQYKFSCIALLFVLMVIANTGIHFLQTKTLLKKDLSKSLENKHILAVSYAVKCASALLTCCVLSSNVIIISQAINYFKQADIWEQLGGYSYYRMTYPFDIVQKLGDKITDDEVLWGHFNEQFGKDAIWMVDVSGSYEHDAAILNENAIAIMLPYVSSDLKNRFLNIEQDKLYLFLPSAYRDSKQVEQAVEMTTVAFLGDRTGETNNLNIETYSGHSEILGVNRKTNLYSSRFLDDPIIIVDTRGYMASKAYLNVMYTAREVLYRLDNGAFQSFLDLETVEGCITRSTDAVDLYQYNQSSIARTFKLMLAVSFFIFLLELMMIVFLVRLEYTMNGMEIAVKKTLGYFCLERTKKIAVITVVSISLCTILAIITSQLFHLGDSVSICICGAFLLTAEIGLILYEAIHMDRARVCSILKGAQI
ncbi:hypothetical protein OBV_15370 [Oscillibacter valericigenes Sjm18-20]|nr:hypothetical protein OBV_15370 [Oscillibacter valericigenes Sjm18-20]